MRASRVGFIGTGWPERVQIAAFRKAGLRPQAICSRRAERAKRVARRFEIPEVYTSWRELVRSETVDLVSIATPPRLHADIAMAALEAGKHVLCEAPVQDVAEAEAMLEAAEAHPECLALMDYELRFTPARRAVRRLLGEQALGRVLWIEADYRFSDSLDPRHPWTWEHDLEQGGGLLNTVGSHLLDLCAWLLGPIRRLTGQVTTVYPQRFDEGQPRTVTADDHVHLLLEFQNGVQGTVTASTLSAGQSQLGLVVYGTEGSLRLDGDERLWQLSGDAFPDGAWDVVELEGKEEGYEDPFSLGTAYLARELVTALQATPPRLAGAATFKEGLIVQQMLHAVRRSCEEGVWAEVVS